MKKLVLMILAASFAAPALAAEKRANFVVITGNYASKVIARAWELVVERDPRIKAACKMTLVCEENLKSVDPALLKAGSVGVVDIMSSHLLQEVEKTYRLDLLRSLAGRGGLYPVNQSSLPEEYFTKMGAEFDPELREYWKYQGAENLANLFRYILKNKLGFEDLKVDPPRHLPKFAYYHPEYPGQVVEKFEDYEAWLKKEGRLKEGRPWVGISNFSSAVYQEQQDIVTALIASLEKRNYNVLTFFGYPAGATVSKLAVDRNGKRRIDFLMAFNFRFSATEGIPHLEKLGVPVMNLIRVYGRSEKEWRESPKGLSLFEAVFQMAVPEVSGLIAPMVVGSEEKYQDPELGTWYVKNTPIQERLDLAIDRVDRYLKLQSIPASEKKAAVFYYNYPPGKANVGASYLNVAASLISILDRLKKAGWRVGEYPRDPKAMVDLIQSNGRNIDLHAHGELSHMVGGGGVTLVPVHEYRKWFGKFPEKFRQYVERDWGKPDPPQPMFYMKDNRHYLVVPVNTFGNVAVLPQPARGFSQDLEKLYHADDVSPTHAYAGSYAWVRWGFKADAVVHLGTHGTHEWLTGKDAGQETHDPPEALLGDLPNIYPYVVDDVGEALVARRRGLAAILTHMMPPMKKGGLYHEYAEMKEMISDHDRAMAKEPNLALAFAEQLREKITALGLQADLGLNLEKKGSLDHDQMHKIEEYLNDLKKKNIPYGLHTYAQVPDADLRQGTAEIIREAGREISAKDLDRRMVQSGADEGDHLVDALNGLYVPPGTGHDPVRNPDSLPTGRNVYGVDPNKVPKQAAWKIGVKLADEMIARHLTEHGKYPQKVSFVIWGTSTLRHEGVIESQILHLLGTKPVWSARGKVVDVEVVPKSQLARPRIDIVISSSAEGMFSNITQLMDKAVQKVAALKESENYVRQHSLAVQKKLEAKGYTPEEAAKRAGVRIFDEPPGTYNLKVSSIVGNSGSWDSEKVIVDDYFRKMGHGYGNGFWGEKMEDVFRLQLSGTDTVVHSAASQIYGTLDNDDFFMYAGGLAQAIRHLDGKSPELLVANLRTPGGEKMVTAKEMIGGEFRSRFTNPEWIKGMEKEGYAGAGMMRKHFEHLWGWQVTVPETISGEHWDQAYEVYLKDKYDLKTKEFFEEHSPHALQDITARLLETSRKGYWKPSEEVKKDLAKTLVESANKHRFSCADFVCGNPSLMKETLEWAAKAKVPQVQLDQFKKNYETVVQTPLDEYEKQYDDFKSRTAEAKAVREKQVVEARAPLQKVKGYVMEKTRQAVEAAKPVADSIKNQWGRWLLGLSLLAALVMGWRRTRRGPV